jgi:predicted deacylase
MTDHTLVLGTAKAAAGTVSWGTWSLDDDHQIPVCIACGAKTKPVVWIQAGMHGNEFDSLLVAQGLCERLGTLPIRGTLAVLLGVNQAALQSARRTSPADGKDLNRQFPGTADGSYSERLGDRLWATVRHNANFLIDIYSSTIEMIGVPHIIYTRDADTQASQASRDMAERSQLPVLWENEAGFLGSALITQAVKAGIPSVLYDVGELDHEGGDITHRVNDLLRILSATGVISDDESSRTTDVRQLRIRDPEWVRAEVDGLLRRVAKPGTSVKARAPLFEVIGPTGTVLQTAFAPFDALVISVRRERRANAGTEVVSVGTLV